jgi:ABC-type polar amino acid transport system ATPase subunit
MEGGLGMNALTIDGLRLRRGAREVLRGVNFGVERGELVALMGLSGGGKTTVLRAVTALEPFDAGTIDVGGVMLHAGGAPARSTLRELRRGVGMVFQLHHLFDHLTAIENVTLAPMHVARTARAEAEQRAIALLESLGVAHRRNAFPRELSGGEAQRVAIARAMAMDPPLLLMDEPTASLDPARRFELGQTLRSLTTGGRTLLITTHDDDFARDFATRVVVMADGAVVEEGDPREVLTHPQHAATRAFLQNEHRASAELRAPSAE